MMGTGIKIFLAQLILQYQKKISPLFGPRCRYYPSCSQYSLICLKKFSLALALIKIVGRLLRCNPLFAGGEDIP